MTTVLIALGGVATAIIAALSSWAIARRNTSGSTEQSNAQELWVAGHDIRVELADALERTNLRLEKTTAQLDAAVIKITELLHQVELSNAVANAAKEAEMRAVGEMASLRLVVNQVKAGVNAVHEEVKTGNALTIAQLADNTETRRIDLIPEDERTKQENEHTELLGIQHGGSDKKAAGDHE